MQQQSGIAVAAETDFLLWLIPFCPSAETSLPATGEGSISCVLSLGPCQRSGKATVRRNRPAFLRPVDGKLLQQPDLVTCLLWTERSPAHGDLELIGFGPAVLAADHSRAAGRVIQLGKKMFEPALQQRT